MKVPAGLPLACCCWLALVVTSTLARPQKLQLTPREFKAFKTVLGNKRALSITSAVPVMAFSDKNPTKYVELPLDQIGGQTGHPSPAELLDTTSEKFGTVYGRGAGSSGPAFGGSETGKYQGVVNFNAGDLQRGGEYDSVASDSRVFGPDKVVPLTYGFKPIYDSVSSSQGIIPKKAPGGLVRASFSPSKQVGQGLFRPITSSKGDDGLLERTPKLGSDENLFRHHVDSSLVSTTGGGPGTKAVGKLLKSRNPELDESDVVVRSVDGRTILNALLKEANAKTLIDVSGGALQSSAAVGASIAVHDSSKGQLKSFKEEKLSLDLHELSNGGFVSDSGAIVVRGGDSKAREALPDPSASIFDSSRIEASSIFPSNSVRIPQLPNIQLPLQTQEARSFEGQELPLETSQSTFTGNQQQVKLILEQSNSEKRQVPQIPSSVKPSVKTTATANTESLLRLLRSQAPSEPEPTTSQGKFTREISPQARQIPGAIPSKVSPSTGSSGTTSAIPPGFRPIPATPRQNSRRSANPSSDQTRTSIKFNNAASQQAQRPQVTQPQPSTRSIQQSKTAQQVSSARPVQQPRTNTQIGAVSHQFQQQFHPQFSPGPFSANTQTNSANQLKKLQQRQQQQQQEQKQRVQVQEKRQDQLKEQQVLQQLAERYEKQQQRQQQQSQQQREQQQRQQRQQQHQQRQQQQQQQQRQPLQQQKQQQRQQPLQQQKQQHQQQFLQQQQNQQQRQQPLQQQKQQQQHQSLQQQKQQQQQQQKKFQQSGRLGTKVTSGQRQTLEEFLAGNSKPVSQLQQRPRLTQTTTSGKVSQQPNLQQTQTRVITKSNTVQAGFQQAQHSAIAKPTAQQPRLQQSNVKQTFTAGTQQLGSQAGKTASGSNQVRLQQFQTGTSNSAFSGLSQQVRLVQNPTPTATKVVAKQQVQAKPQPKPVQTSIVQQAKKPTAQSLSSTTSPGGTSVISASSGASIGSLPPSALQALGANFGGGGAGGGQSHIVVKTLSLDAKDADPSSEAFKKALAEATKQARLELGVSESEELGVASGDLANLFGKKRRKRQLFGGESSSNAQTVGNALSTGAGLFGSTLGVLMDTVWEAVINFLRGTETVSLLVVDQVSDMLRDPVEER